MTEYPFKDLLPIDEVLEQEGYYKDWTHLDPKVFYSLTQISEYIKTKGFGVDVRLLIAQLAEHFGLKSTQIIDLANLLQQKFENLEGVTQSFTNNINSLVAQMEADKDAVIANATVDSEVILARGGKPTLQARLDETTAQLEQIGVNVKDFGAKGDGSDETEKIQNAFDYAGEIGGTVEFEGDKTYYVDAVKSLKPKSHTTINFKGAKIKALPTAEHRYAILSLEDVDNITLINPYLIGDRDEHITTPSSAPNNTDGFYGEWGYGVRIRGCRDITIVNAHAEKCWGDGFVISSYMVDETQGIYITSNNIQFLGRTTARDCRRQGMSVIDVNGLYIDTFQADRIRGTQPSSGIDFEPDHDYQKIKNVSIGEVTVTDSITSVLFSFRSHFDITIERVNSINCNNPFDVYGLSFPETAGTAGRIKIGTWYVNKVKSRFAMRFSNWYVGYTPHVTINNFIIDSWDNSTTDYIPPGWLAFVSMEFNKENTHMKKGGGIAIHSYEIRNIDFGTRDMLQNVYLVSNNQPTDFSLDDITVNFTQNTKESKTRSVGLSKGVVFNRPNHIITPKLVNEDGGDFNELIPPEVNDRFNFYMFDTGLAGTENAPQSGRGGLIQYNDPNLGRTQIAILANNQSPLRVRMIRQSDGEASGWKRVAYHREVPESRSSPGVVGDFSADSNYLYVCYTNNYWIRIPKDNTWV